MRIRFSTGVLVVFVALVAGCGGSTDRAIATGTLERVTIWRKPVQRPGEMGENDGNPQPKGSKVEVYDQFILVTPPNGPTVLSVHGWYTDLEFRR